MVFDDAKMELQVALVSHYPLPGRKAPGGVRAAVQNLVRGLETFEDLRLHVVYCHSDIEKSSLVETKTTRFYYLALPRRRVIPNLIRSIPRVQRILNQIRPDVVNSHLPHYTLASLRAGYPTIYTIHGVVHREALFSERTLFNRLRFLVEGWQAGKAVRRASEIVAISPYIQKEYHHWTQARFHVIENPLPPEFFSLPNLEEPDRLLYPGTISERKNIVGLLEALALVRRKKPRVHLRLAGRSLSRSYFGHVQEFIKENKLGSNVEFLGLLDGPALREEYARCSAVVLASRQETVPMAVMEAMAAGKPVVSTDVGGLPYLVEDGKTGFIVKPADTRGFASRLLQLLENADLRKTMGSLSRRQAERFRLDVIAPKYRRLYYALAGRPLP